MTEPVPLFNLVPSVGEPARFGFVVDSVPAVLDTSVRTGGDYGVVASASNIPQSVAFEAAQVTFWGVPGDPRHDQARGWLCLNGAAGCTALGVAKPPPFLTLPTSCTGPLQTTVEADSWKQRGVFQSFPAGEPLQALDGCDRLPFGASISVAPDVEEASTPTGLTVGVHVPQEAASNAEGLAGADVRDTTVVLPEGVTINPGGADGLEACSEGQIGFQGKEAGEPATNLFTSGLPNPFCPDASKIGTVEIETPLLPHALKGAVYLAAQNENPFGSLIAMYLVAEDPVSGVLVKQSGEVSLDPSTGRITTTFKNMPQQPWEDVKLHLYGGARAPLSTPSSCGSYETKASFTPWSGNEPVQSSSTFNITTGPNGGPCADPRPFAPGFAAGSTNHPGGRVHAVHDDDEPSGRRSAAGAALDEAAAGPARAGLLGQALPRTAGVAWGMRA